MFKTLFCIYHHFSFLGMRLKDSIRSTWHLLILQRTYTWNENKKDSTNHVTRRDQSLLRYASNCRESPYAKNGSVLRFLKPVWNSVCLKQPLSETNSFWNNLCNVVIYYTPLNTVYNENWLLNLDFLWCLLRNKKKPKDYFNRNRSTSFYLLYYYRLWWRTSPVSVTWNICLP